MKKIIGVTAVLLLVAVAFIGAGAAASEPDVTEDVNSSDATYTYTFDPNGATTGSSFTKTTEQVTIGGTSKTRIVLPGADAGWTKTGSVFAGWNTAADGSGTKYSVGQAIENVGGNATLYAVWTDGLTGSGTLLDPYIANNELSLRAAITAGGYITVTADIAVTDRITVAKDVILDLNGHNITLAVPSISKWGVFLVDGAGGPVEMTINDSVGTGVIGGEDHGCGILIKGGVYSEAELDPSKYASLTVNGGKIIGYYYGISGNGYYHNTKVIINGGTVQGTNSSVTGTEDDGSAGIYNPQYGTLTVNGGTIEGYSTGIEIRAGYLNVTNGTIRSTCDDKTKFCWKSNGNGTTCVGTAVAVAQHNTQRIIVVNLSGGTFEGIAAFTQASTESGTTPESIAIYITGGTFTSTEAAPFTYTHAASSKDYIIGAVNINDYDKLYNKHATISYHGNIISGGTFPVRTSEELSRYSYFRDTTAENPNVTLKVISDVTLQDETEYSEVKDPVIMKGVTLQVATGKTLTVPDHFTMTIQDGGKVVVDGTLTVGNTESGAAEVRVNEGGILDATNGTLNVVSKDTVYVNGTLIADSLNNVENGSIQLASTGNITVTNESVTLDVVKAKIKAGTKKGAEIILCDSTGTGTVYEIKAEVVEDGKVTADEIGQDKGTDVTLTVNPTFTFYVPEAVVLSTTAGGKVEGAYVQAKSDAAMTNKKMVVSIASEADADTSSKYTYFKLTSGSNAANYQVLEHDASPERAYEGSNGTDNVLITQSISESAQDVKKEIDFKTISIPEAAGTYAGKLIFNFSVVDIA